MKVRDLVEALLEEDQERRVVVPWVVSGVARECVGIKEVDLDLDEKGDYTAHGSRRVIALIPESRKPDEKSDQKSDGKSETKD